MYKRVGFKGFVIGRLDCAALDHFYDLSGIAVVCVVLKC